jgi:hypothetical protein
VTKDGPGDTAVLELFGRDLTGEGTVGLVEDVLRRDLEALAEMLACEEEVEGWGCDNDLLVWCQYSSFWWYNEDLRLLGLRKYFVTYLCSGRAWPC